MFQHYINRAMTATDPRFKRIYELMGYKKPEELTELREQYKTKFGKRPFHGWDAAALREKLASPRMSVPESGDYLLEKGERVTTERLDKALEQ